MGNIKNKLKEGKFTEIFPQEKPFICPGGFFGLLCLYFGLYTVVLRSILLQAEFILKKLFIYFLFSKSNKDFPQF